MPLLRSLQQRNHLHWRSKLIDTQSNQPAAARPEEKIAAIDPPEKGFFSKLLDYDGIPIKAHKDVSDEALFAAKAAPFDDARQFTDGS